MSYFHRFLSWFAAYATFVLLASPAQAQETVSFAANGAVFSPEDRRADDRNPRTVVSREDCLNDDPSLGDDRTYFEFDVNVSATQQGTQLTLWVGQELDCSNPENRQTGDNCTLVARASALGVNSTTLRVYPRLLLTGYQDVDSLPEVAGGASTADYPNEETCDGIDQYALTFHALVMVGDEVKASAKDATNVRIDLQPPEPPSSVSASAGENTVFLDWALADDFQDPDLYGFTFYCKTGDTNVEGAGGAGGSNGGAATTTTVSVEDVCDDGTATIDDGFTPCGSTDGAAVRTGNTKSLENDTEVAVAVVATDIAGNESELSMIGCATPALVYTFFEQYRDAGGKGGDFCSFSPSKTSSAWLLLLLASGAWLLRRTRNENA